MVAEMGQELVGWTGKPCSAQVVSSYTLQDLAHPYQDHISSMLLLIGR